MKKKTNKKMMGKLEILRKVREDQYLELNLQFAKWKVRELKKENLYLQNVLKYWKSRATRLEQEKENVFNMYNVTKILRGKI